VKILLLQNMLYVPALGGANKANRMLLEGLSCNGHKCQAVVPALGSHGSRSPEQFFEELQVRSVRVISQAPEVCIFECSGVEVHAVFTLARLQAYAADQIRLFKPDYTLVSSQDPGQLLLSAVWEDKIGQVIYLAHSPWDLPFGPHSLFNSVKNTEMVQRADGIITVSNYLKAYIKEWGGLDSAVIAFPVYGETLPVDFAAWENGYVTLVNPSGIKGISIFESLAVNFPAVRFAAVPTWATTEADKSRLQALPNVELWEPCDDIERIFDRTKVLLVPSLWPEAFGLIVVEAMLRGIPVMASNSGGLPEAKLGVDYVLPVVPIEPQRDRFDERNTPISIVPGQDLGPWQDALKNLLDDQRHYQQVAKDSRTAAAAFVAKVGIEPFEEFFESLSVNKSAASESQEPLNEEAGTSAAGSNSILNNLSPEKRALLALRILKTKKKA
jgi:glycosyltransferase involved in cell wall biosynthesis